MSRDPKVEYREQVDFFASRGEISPIGRSTLDVLCRSLQLSVEEAAAIEADVLRPYQEYKQKLQQYEQTLKEFAYQEYPLSQAVKENLQRIQNILGLQTTDILPIESRVLEQAGIHWQKRQQYEQAFTQATQQSYPLTADRRLQLQQLQQTLGLSCETTEAIEKQIILRLEDYRQKLQQYGQQFEAIGKSHSHVNEADRAKLQQLQQDLALKPEDVTRVEQELLPKIHEYHQKLQQYKTAFTQAAQQAYPLTPASHQQLQQLQQDLGLPEAAVTTIATTIGQEIEAYRQQCQRYQQAVQQAAERGYPLSEADQTSLNQLGPELGLKPEDKAAIEAAILTPLAQDYQQKLRQYEQVLTAALERESPLTEVSRRELQRFQQVLKLREQDVAEISARLEKPVPPPQPEPAVQAPTPQEPVAQPQPRPTKAAKINIAALFLRPRLTDVVGEPRQFNWLLGAGLATTLLVTLGGYGLLVAPGLFDAGLNTLYQATEQAQGGDLNRAIQLAQSIPSGSAAYAEAQTKLVRWQQEQRQRRDRERLDQARQLFDRSEFTAAFAALQEIPTASPIHTDAQQQANQWAEMALKQATLDYQRGKLDPAIALVKAIPTSTPSGKKAQEAATRWPQEWQADEKRLKTAQQAIKDGQWQMALDTVNQMANPYWKQQSQTIVQQANAGITRLVATEGAPEASVSADGSGYGYSGYSGYSGPLYSESVIPGMNCGQWVTANNRLGGYYVCR